jgi:hypothetical protein
MLKRLSNEPTWEEWIEHHENLRKFFKQLQKDFPEKWKALKDEYETANKGYRYGIMRIKEVGNDEIEITFEGFNSN